MARLCVRFWNTRTPGPKKSIQNPLNDSTSQNLGCSWTTPLKNWLRAYFYTKISKGLSWFWACGFGCFHILLAREDFLEGSFAPNVSDLEISGSKFFFIIPTPLNNLGFQNNFGQTFFYIRSPELISIPHFFRTEVLASCNASESRAFHGRASSDFISFWANHSDLSGGHPKWWFSKESPPKIPLIQV